MHAYDTYDDKRVYQRFPGRLPAVYSDPASEKNIAALTHDISQEGICLVTDSTLSPGSLLDITLELQNGNRHYIHKAMVVWVSLQKDNFYRVGIKLENDKLDPISISLTILTNKKSR